MSAECGECGRRDGLGYLIRPADTRPAAVICSACNEHDGGFQPGVAPMVWIDTV